MNVKTAQKKYRVRVKVGEAWKQVSSEDMINMFKLDLINTPKWRVFKRRQIRQAIDYWTEVSNEGDR